MMKKAHARGDASSTADPPIRKVTAASVGGMPPPSGLEQGADLRENGSARGAVNVLDPRDMRAQEDGERRNGGIV